MATLKQVVTVPKLKVFKDETDKVYVAKEEGKQLIETTAVTKLAGIEEGAQKNNITKVTVNGQDQTIADGTLTIDVEAIIQGDGFVKTDDLSSYLQTSAADEKYATKEEIAKIGLIKGTCLNEELETKKADAKQGDIWIVTDDGNHLHYYNGEDFIDCGTHVDLAGYAKTTEVAEQYATKTELGTKAETSALDNYVKTADLSEATDDEIKALFAAAEEPAA